MSRKNPDLTAAINMRVTPGQKRKWIERAEANGMTLTNYVCFVLDRARIKLNVEIRESV